VSVPDATGPAHAAFVARLAGLVRQGGTVLDVSRTPGPDHPALLDAGLHVTDAAAAGLRLTDALAGPQVTGPAASPARFDGLLAVGALAHATPEHWPAALAALLKPGAPAYLTFELPDGPPRDQLRRALTAAGLTVTEEADSTSGWHLLLVRT
jgi:hypothetical protein